MIFVSVGEAGEVVMIGIGETGRSVKRLWMGDEVIQVLVMNIGVTAHTEETHWMGGEGTLIVMIGFRISVVNFATGGRFFVATSFILLASGSQKKEYSDDWFGCRDVVDVEILDGEATLFMFSASGIQKKERSEMGFI